MKKKKLHKVDLIFIIGIITVGTLCGSIDGVLFNYASREYQVGFFPIISMMGGYLIYLFLLVLLIYSIVKYDAKNRPIYVRGYMFFIIYYIYLAIVTVSLAIVNAIMNIFYFFFS